jgi:hypothetical protein
MGLKWELIKKGAEEGLETLQEGVCAAEGSGKILEKEVELTSVQSQVGKIFLRLGSLAYEFYSKQEGKFYRDGEVKRLIGQIEGHKIKVQEIETEIEKILRQQRLLQTLRSILLCSTSESCF